MPGATIANITRPRSEPRIIKSGQLSSMGLADRMTRNLGWFSLALGAVQLIAPRQITRALGIEGSETLMRFCGAREIASGLVSLSVDKDMGLLSRIGGDAIDIAVLAGAWDRRNPQSGNVGLALALFAGITALDVVTAQAVRARHQRTKRPRDYANRSGFPQGVEQVRGAAADMAKALTHPMETRELH